MKQWRSVIAVAVIVAIVISAHLLNLGPALARALLTMHGGQ